VHFSVGVTHVIGCIDGCRYTLVAGVHAADVSGCIVGCRYMYILVLVSQLGVSDCIDE